MIIKKLIQHYAHVTVQKFLHRHNAFQHVSVAVTERIFKLLHVYSVGSVLDSNLKNMHATSSFVKFKLWFEVFMVMKVRTCCFCLTLKLEAAGSSSMVVATCMTTWCHSPVYCILNNQAVSSFLFQNAGYVCSQTIYRLCIDFCGGCWLIDELQV